MSSPTPLLLQDVERRFIEYIDYVVYLKRQEVKARKVRKGNPSQANADALELVALRTWREIHSPDLCSLLTELAHQRALEKEGES